MIQSSPVDLTASPVDLMSSAASTVGVFNHRMRPAQLLDGCLAPPDAYSIIGFAGELAHNMPQALSQISTALHRSVAVYRLHDRDNRPSESVAAATRALHSAGQAFTAAVRHLADALSAIADP